jgi:hypothetical protein
LKAGQRHPIETLEIVAEATPIEKALIQPSHYRKVALQSPRAEDFSMSRLAIACVLTLVSTAANAQDTRSQQPPVPTTASADETRPFLFDGRMIGDGKRQNAPAGNKHPNAGAIVLGDKKTNLAILRFKAGHWGETGQYPPARYWPK